jgi:hypothetical protein
MSRDGTAAPVSGATTEVTECGPAASATVKFRKYYVSKGAEKARVHYSVDNRTDGRKCVTLYAKDYGHALSRVLGPDVYKNDTDYQTDYFDKGRAVLFEDHPLYAAARARAEAV